MSLDQKHYLTVVNVKKLFVVIVLIGIGKMISEMRNVFKNYPGCFILSMNNELKHNVFPPFKTATYKRKKVSSWNRVACQETQVDFYEESRTQN